MPFDSTRVAVGNSITRSKGTITLGGIAMVRVGDVLERPTAARVDRGPVTPTSVRRLPGSRAVIGALLIAVAAVGVVATMSGVGDGPVARYVVAARPLSPGHLLTADDLTTVAVDLPESLAGRAFQDASGLTGTTVLAPLAAGELVQAGALVRTSGDGRRELSFPVETDLALGGALVPGESIDVIATFGSGADAVTRTVVDGADLVRVVEAGASMGGRFTVITVALEAEDDVLALGHAVRQGKVVVVRSTGAARWSGQREARP